MSIWTFRVFLTAGLLAFGAACVPIPEDVETTGAPALTYTKLSRGMSLQAPGGYCLDPESLTEQFALLARCDTLGQMTTQESGTPFAIITVSAPRLTDREGLPDAPGLVAEQEALLDSFSSRDLRVVHVAGQPPAEGLSGRHWRGAGRVGRNIVGLAIYPAAGASALDKDGLRLLQETFKGMSIERTAAKPPENQEEKQGEGLFARLFR